MRSINIANIYEEEEEKEKMKCPFCGRAIKGKPFESVSKVISDHNLIHNIVTC